MLLKEKFTTEEARRAFALIAHTHRLRLIILYGSIARGRETIRSDADVGILGEEPLSHEDEALITEAIARAVGVASVEVRSLHRTSPFFLSQVMHEGIVLFTDTPVRPEALKLYSWKLAAETKHLRDKRFASAKERIEAYVR